MSKIFYSFILSIFLLSSCASFINTYEDGRDASLESDRFVIFETKYTYKLVFDRETGVEYFYSINRNSGSDYFAPILDKDGKPKIHNEY